MREIKSRILTSLVLISVLYFSLLNDLTLIISLFIILYVSLFEIHNIYKIIFKLKKNLNFIILTLSFFYLIFFSITLFKFLYNNNIENKNLFLFIISICISTDIGGYLFGKIFKGKKLTSISPNKTYSGMIGSFILSILISVIFFKNLNLTLNYLFLTILISLFSQTGDLIISFIKRKANIKDTGKFLPGHGGLLDRLDGILLAVPIGIHLVSI